MNIRNFWIIIAMILLPGIVPAFAADQSICSDGSTVIAYASGKLRSCDLKNNYDVKGVTCQSDYEIVFYETGDLFSCILYNEVTVNGIKCQPEGLISFYPDGRLNTCVKSSD